MCSLVILQLKGKSMNRKVVGQNVKPYILFERKITRIRIHLLRKMADPHSFKMRDPDPQIISADLKCRAWSKQIPSKHSIS